MTRIFVFTAGKREARNHLDLSVRNPIDPGLLSGRIDAITAAHLRRIAEQEGGLFAWGARPGKQNIPNWEKMRPGDFVLTVFSSAYRYVSRVTLPIHNANLAEAIWGRSEDGDTWEYMYFLTRPQPVSRRLEDVPDLSQRYMGFFRVPEDKLDYLRTRYLSIENFLTAALQVDQSSSFYVPGAEWIDALNDPPAESIVDATSDSDARRRVFAQIVQRQGQGKFRKAILAAYGGRCAISGCDAEPALEAAHILPYRGAHTNEVVNGLLLRADLHTLFDLRLIAIDPADFKVIVAPEIEKSVYGALHRKVINLPVDRAEWPLHAALGRHLEEAGLQDLGA